MENVAYPCSGILFRNKRDVLLVDARIWISLGSFLLSCKSLNCINLLFVIVKAYFIYFF